jgi:predicted NBD/HSP70 family sugar kinase
MRNSNQGMSKDDLKSNNMYAILSILYKKGAMPRKDIAESVKLTPATVTLLTNEMIQNGLLAQGDEITDSNQVGRRKVLVDINYKYGYVCGIYIEQEEAVVALAYLNGECIANKTLSINPGTGAKKLVDCVKTTVDEMIEVKNLDRKKFCYAGVSIVGYVNPEKGISEDSYGLFEKNCEIKSLFESCFDVPVTVDNNVRALAIAEIDFNRVKEKINGLFIKHSPGLGGAIIMENSVYSGAHHHSGELGHFTVNPEGKRCVCGKRGCVSTIVNRTELISKASDILNPDTTPVLWVESKGNAHNIDLDMMLNSSLKGDLPIRKILDIAAEQIAIVIENSMELINGDIVITFGKLLTNQWFNTLLEEKLDYISCGTRTYRLRNSKIKENELWKASIAIAVRQLLRLLSQDISGGRKE